MLELTAGPSSTPVCSRVRYAAASQDPFLLAATEASRSRNRRRSFRLALRHVDNAAAAFENNRWQLSAVSLLAAHYHSEGFIELNETFRSLVIAKDIDRPHELDGPTPGGSIEVPDGVWKQVLAYSIASLQQLLNSCWEEAAALAGSALANVAAHELDCRRELLKLGVQLKHVQWTLHTITCSVYSRLLQCPNSSLHGAQAAHMGRLEAHARAAQALRPTAPRAPFELGWVTWACGDYPVAAANFRGVLLLAAEADDDTFVAAGAWALASSLVLGGAGPLVQVAQIAGLVHMAAAAEMRLQRWSMAPAVRSITAFAREPLRRLTLPAGSLCFLAMPELRRLPRRQQSANPQRRCATCNCTFTHMLRCSRCCRRWYCSKECQTGSWPKHRQDCYRWSAKRGG